MLFQTVLDVFQKNINPAGIIIRDGYLSYPSAVKDFKSIDIIVPHTERFTNKKMIIPIWLKTFGRI